MPQLSKANASPAAARAIVLFGLSEDGKPQAGVFPESNAVLTRKAAKQLGLTAIDVSTSQFYAIGAKIPAGRLYTNRKSFVRTFDVTFIKSCELAKSGGAAIVSVRMQVGRQQRHRPASRRTGMASSKATKSLRSTHSPMAGGRRSSLRGRATSSR